MRHKLVKIKDMLRTRFAEVNATFLAEFQIIKEALASEANKFAGNDISRHDALRVAYAICNFSH